MSKPEPNVVDISNGSWQFAYPGHVVRHALYERASLLEQEYVDIMNHIKDGFEDTSAEAVIAAFVQTFSTPRGWRADMLTTVCKKAAEIHTEILELRRAANGFSETIIYRMSLEDLERLGLGLLSSSPDE